MFIDGRKKRKLQHIKPIYNFLKKIFSRKVNKYTQLKSQYFSTTMVVA